MEKIKKSATQFPKIALPQDSCIKFLKTFQEVVDEGNIVQICNALCRMLDPKYFDKLKEQARWDEYYNNHSVVKLREAMSKLLKTL